MNASKLEKNLSLVRAGFSIEGRAVSLIIRDQVWVREALIDGAYGPKWSEARASARRDRRSMRHPRGAAAARRTQVRDVLAAALIEARRARVLHRLPRRAAGTSGRRPAASRGSRFVTFALGAA